MSNLQDVPLAELENMPKTEQDTAGTKSNSLKRFFKLGKKSNSGEDFNEEVSELEDEASKDASKPSSMSRFLTQLKGTSKTGNVHFEKSTESAVGETNAAQLTLRKVNEKPVPNAKPTLKTTISSYWKQLFHRQKAFNRQAQPNEEPTESQQEQQEQQEQQADPIKAEADEAVVTADKSREDTKVIVPEKSMDNHTNCLDEILDEVQELAISEETGSIA